MVSEAQENKLVEFHAIANELIKKYAIKTIKANTIAMEEVRIYKDGYYHINGIPSINDDILQNSEHFNDGDFRQILSLIKAKNTRVERDDIEIPDNFENLNNGVLCYKDGHIALLEHEPIYNFTYKIPVNYISEAKCPKIDSVVKVILGTEEKIKLFYEYVGSLLMSKYYVKDAVILLGKPNTGKTTLMNMILQFLGKRNVCSVSIQDLDLRVDKFAGADLDSKLADIVDEIPKIDIKNIEQFKKAVGGSTISVQRKGKDRYNIVNRAKMIFAANETGSISQEIRGSFFEKIVAIECDQIFSTDNKNLIMSQRDMKYSKEEMSGFLNHAIEGLQRLLKNQQFSQEKEDIPTIWNKYIGGNTEEIMGLLSLYEITYKQSDKISLEQIYTECVQKFIKENPGMKLPFTKIQFGKDLSRLDGITKGVMYIGKNANGNKYSVRCWCGIKKKEIIEVLIYDTKNIQEQENKSNTTIAKANGCEIPQL